MKHKVNTCMHRQRLGGKIEISGSGFDEIWCLPKVQTTNARVGSLSELVVQIGSMYGTHACIAKNHTKRLRKMKHLAVLMEFGVYLLRTHTKNKKVRLLLELTAFSSAQVGTYLYGTWQFRRDAPHYRAQSNTYEL
mmetsp:Transcript_66088/g.107233  ORF Transcript_66088/g.107233 Transcript_66088/m.107233 type:complete len:136 (-) Transcript_66088:160-567(-)